MCEWLCVYVCECACVRVCLCGRVRTYVVLTIPFWSRVWDTDYRAFLLPLRCAAPLEDPETFTFLYASGGDSYVFMQTSSFEQIEVKGSVLGSATQVGRDVLPSR